MSCCNEPPKIMPDWKKVFVNRQEFLKLLGLVLGGVMGLIMVIPGGAFFLEYFSVPGKPKWIPVGPLDKFKENETVDVVFEDPYLVPWDGVTAKRSAWLRREAGDKFLAFAINCTHLGCPVRWEKGAELFMCPCHGGVFLSSGDVASGPPPMPLPRYPVRVNNGNVEIQYRPVLAEG